MQIPHPYILGVAYTQQSGLYLGIKLPMFSAFVGEKTREICSYFKYVSFVRSVAIDRKIVNLGASTVYMQIMFHSKRKRIYILFLIVCDAIDSRTRRFHKIYYILFIRTKKKLKTPKTINVQLFRKKKIRREKKIFKLKNN